MDHNPRRHESRSLKQLSRCNIDGVSMYEDGPSGGNNDRPEMYASTREGSRLSSDVRLSMSDGRCTCVCADGATITKACDIRRRLDICVETSALIHYSSAANAYGFGFIEYA